MNSTEIRRLFTRFFEERGHKPIPSSSLIPPPEERTLLFTNAGMNQVKPYFMALARPPASRMTSIQKCFRTSDIEAVGDGSHCTFFEMLGNFSVGDYFKAEAIAWAWELLTAPQPQGLGLTRSRIWATVYLDDDEAYDLWRRVGIPSERLVRFDESENYWFMIKGGAGPCGPNTEVYYDFGADQGCRQPDCAPPTHDCGRFIELWNLVFMTLYQAEDGTRTPLPQRNVDTGAGLERWPMPLLWEGKVDWQGKPKEWTQPPTIYDSDLFQPILAKIAEPIGLEYGHHDSGGHAVTSAAREAQYRAMRTVAEHSRAATFLIADGVLPSNDARGYVLRRLIRRAVYHGRTVSTDLAEVAKVVIDQMGDLHPALVEQKTLITRILSEEVDQFRETMFRGSNQLNASLSSLYGAGQKTVPGNLVFLLHDTYGFPLELTREIGAERGFLVDEAGFEALMDAQRARSRAATRFEGEGERIQAYAALGLPPTEFLGYEATSLPAAVRAILLDGAPVREVGAQFIAPTEAHRVELVLDRTPFYAEGGGQVGDQGEITWPPVAARPEALEGRGPVLSQGRFVVVDTRAVGDGGVVAHVGHLLEGRLSVGDAVEARVDEARRADIMRNHTATHILHAALRQVLGAHVRQAGSLVAPDRLRFDFTHLEALKPAEIAAVEALANQVVRENIPVHIDYQPYEEAIAGGALAFFGDKYADTVRVVGVCQPEADRPSAGSGHGCFSKELCGGTHCHASGDVGVIVVTSEASIGAGMRRIEAVTGRAAVEHLRRQEETLAAVSAALRAPPAEAVARIAALQDEIDALNKRLQALERRAAHDEAESVAARAGRVGDTAVVVARVSAPDAGFLRDLGDSLKSRLGSAVILLAAVIDGRPSFLAMVTPDVAKRVPAGDIVRAAAQAAGGSGGGRPELAQGGGTDPSKIDAALEAGRRLIETKLSPRRA